MFRIFSNIPRVELIYLLNLEKHDLDGILENPPKTIHSSFIENK